jgi:hypothetical protein
MSIAFIPITKDNPLYNEKIIRDKWDTFLTKFSNAISDEFDIEIDQDDFNIIVENCLNKIYVPSSTTSSSSLEVKEVKTVEKEVKTVEKQVKTVEKKEEKKKKEKEERLRCVQILKNNEQCKGKQVKGGQYCTRHSPKEESSSSSSDEE